MAAATWAPVPIWSFAGVNCALQIGRYVVGKRLSSTRKEGAQKFGSSRQQVRHSLARLAVVDYAGRNGLRRDGDAPRPYPWPVQIPNPNLSPGVRKPNMPRNNSGKAGRWPAGLKGPLARILARTHSVSASVSVRDLLLNTARGQSLRQNYAHRWSC